MSASIVVVDDEPDVAELPQCRCRSLRIIRLSGAPPVHMQARKITKPAKENAPCFRDLERPAHTTKRKRKMRCTTRINIPIMTICSDEAAAMVGSPCH